MLRIVCFAGGLFVLLHGRAVACTDAKCSPGRVKPHDISRFMKEQAAATRTAKPVAPLALAPPGAQVPIKAPFVQDSQPRKTVAAFGPVKKETRAVSGQRLVGAAKPQTFHPSRQQPPAVEVVTSDQFNSIDRMATALAGDSPVVDPADERALAYDVAAPEVGPNVQMMVGEAFALIDQKPVGKLEATTLLAADERARGSQNPSWLRSLMSTVGNLF